MILSVNKIPNYKNKGDIQNYTNYCEIKFISNTIKLWERVNEHRLRYETIVSKNQFGSMLGRSIVGAIYLGV